MHALGFLRAGCKGYRAGSGFKGQKTLEQKIPKCSDDSLAVPGRLRGTGRPAPEFLTAGRGPKN